MPPKRNKAKGIELKIDFNGEVILPQQAKQVQNKPE
jgi:hypothetical protein